MRIDGGNWHYTKGWDDDSEYPEDIMEGLGYSNCIYTEMDAGATASNGFANAEFAPGGCCDITKHTYEVRTRYLVMYQPAGEDSNGEEYAPRFIHSDWSTTTSIGKDCTQKRFTCPKTLPAPKISFTKKDYDLKGKWTGRFWFDVVYAKEINDYEKFLMCGNDEETGWGGGWWYLSYYMEAAYNDLSEKNFVEITEFIPTSPLTSSTRQSGLPEEEIKVNADSRILVREYVHSNLEEDNKYYRKTDYAYLVDQVTSLKAKTQDTKSITLTWDKVKDAGFYEIYDTNNKLLGTSETNTFKVEGLKAGTGYDFKVRAVVDDNYVGLFSKVCKTPTAPEATTLKEVTSPKKAYFKATWDKLGAGTGYQVQTATNSKFTKGKKTYKVTKLATLTKSAKKKSGKTYYVRVRGYITYGGKTVYGDWSNSMSIKTKK